MISSSVRIFVATSRKTCVDRLMDCRRRRAHLGEDPDSGALFVFVNKRANRLKALWFDGNGHCILYKRLHRARFALPDARTIDAKELARVLRGVESSSR